MASQSGVFSEAGGSGQGNTSSSEVRSEDLPSKRLLGKGLASIGYETELNGMRFARKDFVGVPVGVFKTEAAKLLGLKGHQNVVMTHYMAADEVCCSLVMDLMDDDFLAVLHKRKRIVGNRSSTYRSYPFELPQALGFMWQIARGMEHLHDQGVVHGDLKTKNILVTHWEDGSLLLKVSDFGLVETKRRSMSYVSRDAHKLGMARWKAPELLKMEDQEETSSESDEEEGVGASTHDIDLRHADVYSFALTCCHLLTGEDPYPNPNWRDLVAKIAVGDLRPTLPAACPPPLSHLLESCWSKHPAQRPPFALVKWKLENLHHETVSSIEFLLPRIDVKELQVEIRLSGHTDAFVQALRNDLRRQNMVINEENPSENMITVGGYPPNRDFNQDNVLAIVKRHDFGAVLVSWKVVGEGFSTDVHQEIVRHR